MQTRKPDEAKSMECQILGPGDFLLHCVVDGSKLKEQGLGDGTDTPLKAKAHVDKDSGTVFLEWCGKSFLNLRRIHVFHVEKYPLIVMSFAYNVELHMVGDKMQAFLESLINEVVKEFKPDFNANAVADTPSLTRPGDKCVRHEAIDCVTRDQLWAGFVKFLKLGKRACYPKTMTTIIDSEAFCKLNMTFPGEVYQMPDVPDFLIASELRFKKDFWLIIVDDHFPGGFQRQRTTFMICGDCSVECWAYHMHKRAGGHIRVQHQAIIDAAVEIALS